MLYLFVLDFSGASILTPSLRLKNQLFFLNLKGYLFCSVSPFPDSSKEKKYSITFFPQAVEVTKV